MLIEFPNLVNDQEEEHFFIPNQVSMIMEESMTEVVLKLEADADALEEKLEGGTASNIEEYKKLGATIRRLMMCQERMAETQMMRKWSE